MNEFSVASASSSTHEHHLLGRQPSFQLHLVLDSLHWLLSTHLCWGRRNGGGTRIYKYLQRFEVNLQQDLCSQGMIWSGKRQTASVQQVRQATMTLSSFDTLSLGSHICSENSNGFSLISFLADKHMKIDLSVIFTISRVAAKEPAGPNVGTAVVSVHLLFSH